MPRPIVLNGADIVPCAESLPVVATKTPIASLTTHGSCAGDFAASQFPPSPLPSSPCATSPCDDASLPAPASPLTRSVDESLPPHALPATMPRTSTLLPRTSFFMSFLPPIEKSTRRRRFFY